MLYERRNTVDRQVNFKIRFCLDATSALVRTRLIQRGIYCEVVHCQDRPHEQFNSIVSLSTSASELNPFQWKKTLEYWVSRSIGIILSYCVRCRSISPLACRC